MGSVDLLAAISQDGFNYLANKYESAAECIDLHRLGIDDLGALAEPPEHGPIRILSVSSMDRNKRVDRIAQSAIQLARSGTEVQWTHLGDGPTRHQVERVLDGRPWQLAVDLRGLVTHDEVVRELLHGQHSVFVNLSLSEGAPVSLMEAQCVGLPVVATRVGGSAEVAPPRWNRLIDVDADQDAIAEAILSAAGSSRADAEGRRNHWLQNYDAKRVYPAYAEMLARLASSGQGKGER